MTAYHDVLRLLSKYAFNADFIPKSDPTPTLYHINKYFA